MSGRKAAKVRMLAPSIKTIDTRTTRIEPKTVDPFYLSAEWKALVAAIKTERWPLLLARQGHCCEDRECKVEHSPKTRIFFDHVLERRDRPDLALVKSNILGRCGSSHTRKTLAERAKRMGAPTFG